MYFIFFNLVGFSLEDRSLKIKNMAKTEVNPLQIGIPVRKVFILLYSFFYAIWGTSWTFPFININYSYLWFGTAIMDIFFSNSKKVSFDGFLIIFLIVVWTILYFFIGIPDNLSSDRSSDFYYLLTYVLKIFLGIFLVFTFVNLFQSNEDIRLFFVLYVCLSFQ